jgi:hypothetical protein
MLVVRVENHTVPLDEADTPPAKGREWIPEVDILGCAHRLLHDV